MIAALWCSCPDDGAHLHVRGRLVAVECNGVNLASEANTVCVKCGRANLRNGTVAALNRKEHLALSSLAVRVNYARRAIAQRIEIDGDSLPTVEQLGELGLVRQIKSEFFTDLKMATDATVRAHMRGLFNIPDGATLTRLTVPGLQRRIIAGERFVEHPFQQQRRRDDPAHMLFSCLAPQTVLESLEVLMVRRDGGRSFKFLGAYRDLSVPPDGRQSPYVYHVAYALGDGQLTTSFKLSGGAQAFRSEREGRLMYAAYAAPIASNA